MPGEHAQIRARRVVTGIDDDGKSTFVRDERTPLHVATPAFAINAVWQVDSVPPPMSSDDNHQDSVTISPPAGGLNYFISSFPPDTDFDIRPTYEKLHAEANGDFTLSCNSPIAGMHSTETVDIVTVISGEIYALVETGETLLRPGDTLIQRGTNHAWSNRSSSPCVVAALHLDAARDLPPGTSAETEVHRAPQHRAGPGTDSAMRV